MTKDNKQQKLSDSTNPATTYSDCYQQCFCSDNLELMKTIESNTIDLIYCDILYGTGKNFMDYKDLYPMREIIESHYIPRIKEMHRILKETGSIYLQMDSRISHWVRCILDDVFTYGNFRNELIWCYNTGGKSKKWFSKKHDNILWYSKSNKYTFNYDAISEKRGLQKRNNLKKIVENGITYFVCRANGKEYRYSENDNILLNDWWIDIPQMQQHHPDRTGYYSQKPKVLLERIIKASSNEGDLVADFYLGSGTTAKVCQELNRNFIGCDINPKAIEITKGRLNGGQ
jgi:DNA modification methylase